MENLSLVPPKVETSVELNCKACGKVVYTETIVEIKNVPVERIVQGTFRQSLDENGEPNGPVIPFCNCKGN